MSLFLRLGSAALALTLAAGVAFAQSTSTDEASQSDTTQTTSETIAPAPPSAEGLAAWEAVYKVFLHPRCANCHTPDDRPRWSGPSYGKTRIHGMNVQRGPDGMGMTGMRCSTCHAEHSSKVAHGPPGAEVWLLAPVEMAWWEKPSSDLCVQLKNPDLTGGRSLKEIAEHVGKDHLVAWAWNPGGGREPAPGSAQETYDHLIKWIAEDAPCPQG